MYFMIRGHCYATPVQKLVDIIPLKPKLSPQEHNSATKAIMFLLEYNCSSC